MIKMMMMMIMMTIMIIIIINPAHRKFVDSTKSNRYFSYITVTCEFVGITRRVDHVFHFLKPVRLDVVSETFHRCFQITNLDLVFVLLVERPERLLGRWTTQPQTL